MCVFHNGWIGRDNASGFACGTVGRGTHVMRRCRRTGLIGIRTRDRFARRTTLSSHGPRDGGRGLGAKGSHGFGTIPRGTVRTQHVPGRFGQHVHSTTLQRRRWRRGILMVMMGSRRNPLRRCSHFTTAICHGGRIIIVTTAHVKVQFSLGGMRGHGLGCHRSHRFHTKHIVARTGTVVYRFKGIQIFCSRFGMTRGIPHGSTRHRHCWCVVCCFQSSASRRLCIFCDRRRLCCRIRSILSWWCGFCSGLTGQLGRTFNRHLVLPVVYPSTRRQKPSCFQGQAFYRVCT